MDGYITQRNMNVLVVGGSGSGKTRFFCKPNIYSANCSYLITDPKGELLRAAGALLAAQGYEVRVFNLIDPSQSDGYNPFSYIHSEKDVLTLIDNLIKNTTPRNASSNDPFWEKAEIALDSALMLYLVSEAPSEEQNFEMVRIAPTYDYRRPLTLCVTNNTVRILRKLLVRLKDETVCIFINSTDTILGLIQTLKLEGRCKVFCADKSVRKLKQQNFTDVSDRLSELAGVNFFTSRFYSAVDIKLDYKPHVIVLTDVFHAPYSIIDPQTEVVQAIGRFRNGIEQAYHITNTCDRLQSVSRDKLFHNLECQERIYNRIRELPIEGEIEHQTLTQALQGMDYKRFVTRTGNRNWFMWDNAWTDARLEALYRSSATIEEEYKDAPFQLAVHKVDYDLTDEDRLRRTQAQIKGTTELWREVVEQIDRIQRQNPDAEQTFLCGQLGDTFSEIIEAATILGKERIGQLGYDRRRIKAALENVEENRLMTSEKMQRAVYAKYNTGDLVLCSEILGFLRGLITDNGIPFKGRVDRQIVKLFFEIADDKPRIKGNKAYLLGKKMFEF